MLVALRVCNVGGFEEATLELGEGMTVLTGETGAGKTLLVEALHLVLGGTERSLPLRDPSRAALAEATFVDAGDEVVCARERTPAGRLRAMLDGTTTSAKVLAERTASLCELHGQHEHQVLRRPGAARAILDLAEGIDDAVVRKLRRERRALLEVRERLGGSAGERARRLEVLEHERAEIDGAGICGPDELDQLLAEAEVLGELVDSKERVQRAVDALDLDGDLPSATERVSTALAELPVSLPAREELLGVLRELSSIAAGLRGRLEAIGDDPARLDALHERAAMLQSLVRKHGRTLADVLSRREQLGEELDGLRDDERRAGVVDAEILTLEAALGEAEGELLELRRAAAGRLAAAVGARFADLALPRARFEVLVGGQAGEDVTFAFSGNPSMELSPLAEAASGGELSRVMLALTLATRSGGGCMVFDEVDAGIGGATARSLAACLRELAGACQVLVVTHLASVAASADHHLVVRVDDAGRGTVDAVAGEDRVRELARMLDGDPEHPDAVAHARSLLERDRAGT